MHLPCQPKRRKLKAPSTIFSPKFNRLTTRLARHLSRWTQLSCLTLAAQIPLRVLHKQTSNNRCQNLLKCSSNKWRTAVLNSRAWTASCDTVLLIGQYLTRIQMKNITSPYIHLSSLFSPTQHIAFFSPKIYISWGFGVLGFWGSGLAMMNGSGAP